METFLEIRHTMEKRKDVMMNTLMLAINVLVFILVELSGSSADSLHMVKWGAAYTPLIEVGHEYYRLFTCMFLHFGFSHLVNNMIVLAFLGDNLERAVGRVRYLLIYVLGGMGASYISYAIEASKQEAVVSAGASGAVFAVIGAMIYVVILHKGRLETLTTRQLLILAGLSIYQGITSVGVDNAAHVGGLVCGFLLAVLLYRKKTPKINVGRWEA